MAKIALNVRIDPELRATLIRLAKEEIGRRLRLIIIHSDLAI